SVRAGGIVRRTAHPNGEAYAGGPQMVEISRDGKRVYWTNSLYSTWDDQFYPQGIPGVEVMANASPGGGLELAKDYWVSFPDGYRAHQIRLAAGHLLAMLLVLLPFAILVALVEWQRQLQIGAGLLVIGFGVYRLVERRHPRALARIRPTQLGLWSFAVAIAHGAGLMLVPIYLGLCGDADLDTGHQADATLINTSLRMAVLVAVVHATAMITAGGCSAWLVYRYLG